MVNKQEMTHRRPPSQTPEMPQTPPQLGMDVEDSAYASGAGDPADDTLEVNLNPEDRIFSPDRIQNVSSSSNSDSNIHNSTLSGNPGDGIPIFDPSVPPPNFIPNKKARKTNLNSDSDPQPPSTAASGGDVRLRVVVESVGPAEEEGKKGKKPVPPPGPLDTTQLTQFRARMEAHIDQRNDRLAEAGSPPVRVLTPWVERGNIIITPRDKPSGQFLIDVINTGNLSINGHKLRAGWNRDLQEVALISIRHESMSKRDPLVLIEDPRKGLATMNDWPMPNQEKEISFLNSSVDPAKDKQANVYFMRVIVSKRICRLIQAQRGQLWVSGGTATAFWPVSNGVILDEANPVVFEFQ